MRDGLTDIYIEDARAHSNADCIISNHPNAI